MPQTPNFLMNLQESTYFKPVSLSKATKVSMNSFSCKNCKMACAQVTLGLCESRAVQAPLSHTLPSLQLITCALIQLIWICFPATDFAQHGSKSLSVIKIQGSLRDALTFHLFAGSRRFGMQDFCSYLLTCGSLRSRVPPQ